MKRQVVAGREGHSKVDKERGEDGIGDMVVLKTELSKRIKQEKSATTKGKFKKEVTAQCPALVLLDDDGDDENGSSDLKTKLGESTADKGCSKD